MSASITGNPGVLVYPAGKRLMYTFSTSTTITSGYRFIVQVFEYNTTEIGKFYLTPNPEGKAFFDLAQVIQGRVKRDVVANDNTALWDWDEAFSQSPENSKGYQVRVGEYIAGETLNQDRDNIYLIDGYQQQRSGLNPSFAEYYPTASTKKTWLTDYPVVSNQISYKMMDGQSAVFAFLANDITGAAPRYMQSRLYDSTGIIGTYTRTITGTEGGFAPGSQDPFLAGGVLLYAAMGPGNLFARESITAGTEWTRIETDLANGGGVKTSNTLIINQDCPIAKSTPTQMAFSNSLGGYDYIRWDGRRTQSMTATDKTYRTLQGTWGASVFAIDPTGADVEVFQKDVKERYILNKLMSSEEFSILSILFKSRQVFIKIGVDWLPCMLNEKSVVLQNEPMSKLTAVTVTAEITQSVRC